MHRKLTLQIRPYTLENAGSRSISAAKQVMVQSVLWWGTTREYWMLYFCLFIIFKARRIDLKANTTNNFVNIHLHYLTPIPFFLLM